jgi:hypothetical protein
MLSFCVMITFGPVLISWNWGRVSYRGKKAVPTEKVEGMGARTKAPTTETGRRRQSTGQNQSHRTRGMGA